jgi:hypothetical protein
MAMKCYQFAASPLSMVGSQLDGNHTVFRSGDNFIFEKMPATDLATVPTPMPTPTPSPHNDYAYANAYAYISFAYCWTHHNTSFYATG